VVKASNWISGQSTIRLEDTKVCDGITVAWVVGKTLEVFKFDFTAEGIIEPTRYWPLGDIGKHAQVSLL
jgi:hypothetical protein